MNILFDLEDKLTGVSGSFSDVDMSITEKELSNWSGKTEENPSMYPILKRYWDYVKFGDNWTPTGTAWSSAFISFVLQNEQFPSRSAHYLYVQDIINGNFPSWVAFSIPKSKALRLNVGDVLVRPRSSSNTSTHGDVVYKIENGLAYLVGGNVSNTAKVVGTLKVDSNGTLQEPIKNYLIILKKKAKTNPLLIGGVVALVGLGLFLNVSMKQ